MLSALVREVPQAGVLSPKVPATADLRRHYDRMLDQRSALREEVREEAYRMELRGYKNYALCGPQGVPSPEA